MRRFFVRFATVFSACGWLLLGFIACDDPAIQNVDAIPEMRDSAIVYALPVTQDGSDNTADHADATADANTAPDAEPENTSVVIDLAKYDLDRPHIPSTCGLPANPTRTVIPDGFRIVAAGKTDYYFSGGLPRGIFRMPRVGGEKERIADDDATNIVVHGDHLIYVVENQGFERGFRSIPTAGGTPTTLEFINSGFIDRFTVGEDAIYWIFWNNVGEKTISQLRKTRLDGSGSEVLLEGLYPYTLFGDRKYLYWTTSTRGINSIELLWRWSIDEPNLVPEVIGSTDTQYGFPRRRQFAMDETYIYSLDQNRVQRVAKVGGPFETIATSRIENDTTSFAIDNDFIYWTETTDVEGTGRHAPGYLRAVAKSGGVPIDVGQPESRTRLFVDGDAIVWTQDGTNIIRLNRWWRDCAIEGATITWLPGRTDLPAAKTNVKVDPLVVAEQTVLPIYLFSGLQTDGRTILFRGNYQWYRLGNHDLPPVPSDDPGRYVSFSGQEYVVYGDLRLRHRASRDLPFEDLGQVEQFLFDAHGAAWLTHDYGGTRIFGVDANNQQTNLALITEPSQVAFALDATHVYWIERQLTYRIFRRLRTGGPAEMLFEDLGPAWAWLQVDDTHVYFIVGEDLPIRADGNPVASVWALPKSSGTENAVQISPIRHLKAATLHPNGLYWVEGDNYDRVLLKFTQRRW